jgi:hypothetical protein
LRFDERVSKSLFFKENVQTKEWELDLTMPCFNLQDPFIFGFKDYIIFGGVEILKRENRKHLSYRNVFYKGRSVNLLTRFSHGLWGMKGIRFTGLADDKIGIFTRLQGLRGGRGKIGFLKIDDLGEFTPRKFSNAPIMEKMFSREEWGGVNEVHVLKNGGLGVLAHIAKFDKLGVRHYYPITFMFDCEKQEFSRMKIILKRSILPVGEAKREDLFDVVYPGGLIRNEDRTADLYVGVGDLEAYIINIKDPF